MVIITSNMPPKKKNWTLKQQNLKFNIAQLKKKQLKEIGKSGPPSPTIVKHKNGTLVEVPQKLKA